MTVESFEKRCHLFAIKCFVVSSPGQWLAKINNLLAMLLNYFLAKQLSMTRAAAAQFCYSAAPDFGVKRNC